MSERLVRAEAARRRTIVAVAAAAIAIVAAPAAGAPHHTSGELRGRVGVLLADHGEPPEYNAWTYESFREFFAHLLAMGVVPRWLGAVDTGTILHDADCPGCDEASASPRLIDAWLRPHDGPATFVPASESLPAHYVVPGGPGLREPDIYEHVGLGAWGEWQRMGGRSPNFDEKLPKKQAVIERLRARFGADMPVRIGYGIDPRIGGGRQGIREALDALVNRDRIESLVVVYHGVGFSDIMQTHHLRHQVAEHLGTLGRRDLPVRYAAPLGTTDHYVAAVVEKVRSELAALPADAAVAVHLSGHGLPTTTCGEYDCGGDAYHRVAADLFRRVRPAIEAAVDRPGRTGVFHVYGDGGEGDDDPANEVAGPIEALDARFDEGWTHVIDVPYEFDSNSRDTLIVLRQGYRRPQPDWNERYESRFTYRGLQVTIANASGGEVHKTAALEAVTLATLGAGPAAVTAVDGGHEHDATAASPAAHRHEAADPAAHPGDVAHHSAAAAIEGDGHGNETRVAGTAHGDAHDAGGGAGRGAAYALVALGAAAAAVGIAARPRLLAGRVLAGALGAQLVGLGVDLLVHADRGEEVHVLENAGHWVALGGLAVTAVATAVLLRRPATSGGRVGAEHRVWDTHPTAGAR